MVREFNIDKRAEDRGAATVTLEGQTFRPVAKLPNKELRKIRRLANEAGRLEREVQRDFKRRERELRELHEDKPEFEELLGALEDERQAAEDEADDKAVKLLAGQISSLLRNEDGSEVDASWLEEVLDYRDAAALINWLLEDPEGNSSGAGTTQRTTTSV